MISLPFILAIASIPLSIGLAYINYKAILKELVGFWWHTIQFFLLVCLGFAFVHFVLQKGLIEITLYVTLLASTHWIVFDLSLNGFRGLPYDYVGYNSTLDKTWRKLTKELGEANTRTLFIVMKLVLFFFTMAALHIINEQFIKTFLVYL